ncbi:hypothetical protein HK104_010811 [Borealophlyctis nickersoniae]|nr:hypothetical protein HK104_010811 [Borealophlyctis nickersoniae]
MGSSPTSLRNTTILLPPQPKRTPSPPPRLPAELLLEILRCSHPLASRALQLLNKRMSFLVTPADLVWGEAGWRWHRDVHNCWVWAARNGHTHIVRLMLRHPRVRTDDAMALREAAWSGHAGVVRLLLDAGLAVDGHVGFSPLMNAAKRGHVETVKMLLDAGVETVWEEVRAMGVAARAGHVDVVQAFLDRGEDDENKGVALMGASDSGHADVVRLLLEAGADVHFEHDIAIKVAIGPSFGHGEVLQILIDAGADIGSGLEVAFRRKNIEAKQILLNAI